MANVNRVVISFLGPAVRLIVIGGSPFFTTARNYHGGGSIPYTELIDGPKETLTPDTTGASKVVEVAWARRREFIITMLGTTFPNANRLSRILPQFYSEEYPNLYCTGADLLTAYGSPRPLTPNTLPTMDCGDIVFDTARYQLTFSRLKYNLLTDAQTLLQVPGNQELCRYVEREVQHSADNLTVPSGAFKWVTPPNDAIQEGGIPKSFPVRQVDYIWHDIPEFYMPTVRKRIEGAIGHANSVAFDTTTAALGGTAGLRGYPLQTMLMIGAHEDPTLRDSGEPFVTGGRLYRVKFSFLYRNNGFLSGNGQSAIYAGWNHLYRGPSFTPQFQLATSTGTALGDTIYDLYYMQKLFNVDPTLP